MISFQMHNEAVGINFKKSVLKVLVETVRQNDLENPCEAASL